jgi:plasmid stabilization system protein ParE
MDPQKPTLKLVRAPTAIVELHEIWQWNAERYGIAHADDYLHYLKEAIEDLTAKYATGKTVPRRPDLHYVLMRRRAKGHGHIAVYSVNDAEVHLLHVFHTAQDWPTRLMEESDRD